MHSHGAYDDHLARPGPAQPVQCDLLDVQLRFGVRQVDPGEARIGGLTQFLTGRHVWTHTGRAVVDHFLTFTDRAELYAAMGGVGADVFDDLVKLHDVNAFGDRVCGCSVSEVDFEVANPVDRLTAYSGLNPRTFERRFRTATGYSPLEYVQTLRIEEANVLLEDRDMPTDQVGEEIGYEDPASFRRLFKRLAGVTPARYRRRFQAISRMPES